MRVAAAGLILMVALATPVFAQSALQKPDDGINTPQPSADPTLEPPLDLSKSAAPAKPAKPKPPVVSSAAPAKSVVTKTVTPTTAATSGSAKAAVTKTTTAAATGAAKPVIAVNYRQCADSYFAGAILLNTNGDAVDTLLQRAQIAGEQQLKAEPADQAQLVQAIKASGSQRAAEIRALDDDAGPKAAQALFRTIRACDAKLKLAVTGPLTFGGDADAVTKVSAPAKPAAGGEGAPKGGN